MRVHLAITYPDGRSFDGIRDFRQWPELLGLDQVDYNGLSVLDVATDEGFWGFWSEWQGAKDVLAIDVERAEDYDWGYEVDEAWCRDLNAHREAIGKRVFDSHHKNLSSDVRYKKASVYDDHGEFDVIFNCGLAYHLRHPLLAFDQNRKSCKGFMLLETLIDNRFGVLNPVCWFYPGHSPRGKEPSNWSGMSTGCVIAMLRNAGFGSIYVSPVSFPHQKRQVFIALVDEEYCDAFDRSSFMRKLSEEQIGQVEKSANWGPTE